jgi:hypothetical protein
VENAVTKTRDPSARSAGSVCYTRHEREILGDLPAAGEDPCLAPSNPPRAKALF